jgi:hypothetical protein
VTTQPVVTRFLARHLWSAPAHTPAERDAFEQRAFERSGPLVRMFYVASLLWVVQSMNSWPALLDLREASPLRPARWTTSAFGTHTGIAVILAVYLTGSLVALILPERRLARALYALGLLEFMALVNSFGKVNHSLHGWLFVALVLVLLPSGPWHERSEAAERREFLTVIWIAQLVILFFYTLTGFWKVRYAIGDFLAGSPNAFGRSGFAYIVADRVLVTSQRTLLGDFFINNATIGWLSFLATMYFETCSVVIVFRPRVQRLWGIILLVFHLGTQLALGFTFTQNIVLVSLLLIFSPFTPDGVTMRDALLDLPIVHLVVGVARRRRQPGPSAAPSG